MSQEKYEKAEIDRIAVFESAIKAAQLDYEKLLNSLNKRRDAAIQKAIDASNIKADENGAILENEAIPGAQPQG